MMFRRRQKRLAPGEFPEHVTRAYVQQTLPTATPGEARRTVEHLRGKGWSEDKLAQHILPFMPRFPHAALGPAGDGGDEVFVPFPVSRQWLDEQLPGMDRGQIRLVVDELERRGWSAKDTAILVLPHLLPKLPDEDALAIVAGLERLWLTEREVRIITRFR